jgi:esterase/lipase
MTDFFESLLGIGTYHPERRISYQEASEQLYKKCKSVQYLNSNVIHPEITRYNDILKKYKKQEEDKMKEDLIIKESCSIKTVVELQKKMYLVKEELNNLIVKILSIQNQLDKSILVNWSDNN